MEFKISAGRNFPEIPSVTVTSYNSDDESEEEIINGGSKKKFRETNSEPLIETDLVSSSTSRAEKSEKKSVQTSRFKTDFTKKSYEVSKERMIRHEATRKYSVVNPKEPIKLSIRSTGTTAVDFCEFLLIGLSYIVIFFTLPISLILCIKIVAEYERAVIFRLGRLVSEGAKGPGLFFIIPCMDIIRKVDLRTITFDVPPQEVLTRDSVTVTVDAVVYYRIHNPVVAVTNVEDADRSTRLLAATTLRNVLGTKNLAEILSEREIISNMMQNMLDDTTDPWGVKVERVEVKDVRLPVQLQRVMAAEAEAAREARAQVIAAEGEHKASQALRQAADVIHKSKFALQLRYLQTLNAISAEKNSTIIFPLPMDMLSYFIPPGD